MTSEEKNYKLMIILEQDLDGREGRVEVIYLSEEEDVDVFGCRDYERDKYLGFNSSVCRRKGIKSVLLLACLAIHCLPHRGLHALSPHLPSPTPLQAG